MLFSTALGRSYKRQIANLKHKPQEVKMKKAYNAPKLTVHGDVEVLTQQGGGTNIDVPQGTNVVDVGDVIGS